MSTRPEFYLAHWVEKSKAKRQCLLSQEASPKGIEARQMALRFMKNMANAKKKLYCVEVVI